MQINSLMRTYVYLGKASDGYFYHIVVSGKKVYLYVRRAISTIFGRRWVTELVKDLSYVPRLVKEKFMEIKKEVEEKTRKVSEELIDELEYAVSVVQAIKNVLTALNDSIRSMIQSIKDRNMRELVRVRLEKAIAYVDRVWRDNLREISKEFEVHGETPVEVLEDVEQSLRSIVKKLRKGKLTIKT